MLQEIELFLMINFLVLVGTVVFKELKGQPLQWQVAVIIAVLAAIITILAILLKISKFSIIIWVFNTAIWSFIALMNFE